MNTKIKIIFYLSIIIVLCGLVAAHFGQRGDILKLRIQTDYQDLLLQAHNKRLPYMEQYLILVEQLANEGKERFDSLQITEVARVIIEQCSLNKDIGITPDKVMALIERESGFDPEARSYANAVGLTQVTKPIFLLHAEDLGFDRGADWIQVLLDPIQSVRFGVAELVRLRRDWISYGVDSWLIVFTSYFWGEKNAWDLLESKRRAQLPSLEYGQGVIELSAKWRDRGVG